MSKKLFSKFFVFLLVVGLLFAVAPTTQAQAQTPSVWDGAYPAARPTGMADPVDGVQLVNTAEEFAWLASQTNMFAGGVTTVKLNVDIDLKNKAWTPSPALVGGATGSIFDGGGHTISNLNAGLVVMGGYNYSALFAGANANGLIIKNLIIDGADVGGTLATRTYVAVVVAANDFGADFINVTVRNAQIEGNKYVAGISTYSSSYDGGANFTNCTVENSVIEVQEILEGGSVSMPHVGGIVGLMNVGTMSGCTVSDLAITVLPVSGQPIATNQVGTLIGTAQASVLVGTNNVIGDTYNGAPYTKLIGLDNRTYKVVNATQMIGYTTIQAAIDATTTVAGDVIEVGPGTYTESLNINKGVTLRAVGLINIVGQATVNASNVTFDGFNLSNPGASYGMVINPGVSNVTVTGNTFENIGSSTYSDNVKGIYLQNGPDSVTIEGNTFRNIHAGAKSVNAIFSGDSTSTDAATGLVIRNNVFENITSATKGGYGILFNNGAGNPSSIIEGNSFNGISGGWTHAIGLEGPTPNALVNRNTFSGLTATSADNTAVFFEANSGLATTSITNNQFLNAGFGVAVHPSMEPHGTVLATPNWWGQLTGPTAGQLPTAPYSTSPWCANAECTEFLPAMATIAPVAPVVCGNTTTTTIDVNISGIPASMVAQGYQLTLHFDPTKTSIASEDDIAQGGFLPLTTGFQVLDIDNTNGTFVIASTIYGAATNDPSKPLAKITLTHLGVAGGIPLTLTDVLLSSTPETDAQPIPVEVSTAPVVLTLNPAVLNVTKNPVVGYCKLAEAVTAADAGDVLQLQADITIPTMVKVTKALTLDLNGKTATVAAGKTALSVDTEAGAIGALIITDSTTGGLGKITGGARAVQVLNGASLVLNKGTLDGTTSDGVFVKTGSSVTVNGGTVTGLYFAIAGNGSAGQGGTTINITGGSLSSQYTAIYHPQAGTLNISGAAAISGHTGIEMRSGTLNISGTPTITTWGGFVANPGKVDGGSVESGDAILVYTHTDYAGEMVINISGGTFTSATGYALREYVADAFAASDVTSLTVTGGKFYGGLDAGEAGAAVTFSTELTALQLPELALKGGLYNTNPASPTVFVFVPYGTVYNTAQAMYEIVGISLNVTDFYYNNNGILRGVSTDFTVTNFVFAEATSVTVELFSGTEGAYVLQQTNTLKAPASWNQSTLSSSFDIFGTYVSGSWNNTRATEYGQHVPPTRVLVTVVLPGGTLTGENLIPDFEYSLIQPSLVAEDFAYMASSGIRGVSAGFHPVNFLMDQALTVKIELFSGAGTTEDPYVLLQTNTSPHPADLKDITPAQQYSGPFDIFGSFVYTADLAPSGQPYWNNLRETEYGQTKVPTRVLSTVTLPGGVTVTAENKNLTEPAPRTDILPGVNGLVTLQGILTPKADVKIFLTSGTVVRDTLSTALSDINYGFTGVETLTYTFTTSQARYLNVTSDSGKTFLVDRDRTLNPLRLFGGDVDQNNTIQVNDASLVGSAWGSTVDSAANINYDGIVNIQDLALVGGNFGMTSATAYNWWSPLP